MDDIKRPTPKHPAQSARTRHYAFARSAAPQAQSAPPRHHQTTVPPGNHPPTHRKKLRLRLRVPPRLNHFWKQIKKIPELPQVKRAKMLFRKQPMTIRLGWGFLAILMIYSTIFATWQARYSVVSYQLSDAEQSLLTDPNSTLASYLTFDDSKGVYNYNQGYTGSNADVAGDSSQPKFTGSFNKNVRDGATINDPVSGTSVTFKPEYGVGQPKKDANRLIYPLTTGAGARVYTLASVGVKEDIVLSSFQGNEREYKYKLGLSDGTEARIEKDGSLGIYGVDAALLGNVSAGSEKDQALLQKARENGKKTNLLYVFPAPFVMETGRKTSDVQAWYTLDGDELTLHARGLAKANYPLTIDPSVYIDSAARLMRGNNETNIDFDVNNELIQKSQTTGARIDTWTSTNNLSTAVWGQGTAVAGGYIYSVGGAGGNSTVSSTYYTAGSYNYSVPAGITSVTIKTWGGGGGGGAGNSSSNPASGDGGGGGYAKAVITVTPSETLTVDVGTGGGKAASNTRGGNGGGYSSVKRSSTFLVQAGGGGGGGGARGNRSGGDGGAGGGANGITGSNGSGGGSATGGVRGTAGGGGSGGTTGGEAGSANTGGDGAGFGATCNATSGSLGGVTGGGGGGGNDNSTCANGGGGGGGRFGGGGGGSTTTNTRGGGGGGGGSSLVTGTSTVETAGSGATPGNDSDTDRNGAGQGGTGGSTATAATAGADGAVVISYTTTGSSAIQTVSWAKFNPNTNAIESPNPGNGACSGWCTDSAYDLPASRKDLSLVAYNGYLYAIGGATGGGTPQSSVYIAKLGANGEPQLWHPTDSNKSNWVYWYRDTDLPAARSKFAAVANNNHIYILGGLTTSTTLLSSNTVQYADVSPIGVLSGFTSTGMQALSASRYGLSAQVYNDVIYVIGGDATFTGTPITTVEYSKLNSSGTMNSWQTTSSLLTSGRMTMGGSYSTIFSGYMYVAGGCTAVNGSGYCTTIASDVQLASINADGSLAPFNTILNLSNQRIGHTLIAWQGGLYRLGGCRAQNTGTGVCDDTVFDVDYGVINPEGEASTVATSVGSGTAPCSGGNPYNCDLPGVSIVGNVLNGSAIMNGYLYIWGGCSNATGSGCTSVSRGVIYTSVGSDGSLTKPASCGSWSTSSSYCYNTTSLPTGGVGAPGVAVFNGYIYSVGGFTASNSTDSIYYTQPSTTNGSISSWSTADLSGGGSIGATDVAYAYAFARANPASAGSVPGNLYILGGCENPGGIGCNNYADDVYKCNLSTTGVPSACSTTNQLQIGAVTDGLGNSAGTGLGAMAGTVYANYVYLIGGLSSDGTYGLDLRVTRYAKIDNNNNIVAVTGSTWVESSNLTYFGRRRGAGFGYNGYLYVVGGYEGSSGILADIEYAKINVSDGSIGTWGVSSVNINERWGLGLAVSNSYAYVIGGCINGAAPTCASGGWTNSVQQFQIYNNDSGAPAGYSSSSTCSGSNTGPCPGANGVDRIGGNSAVLNGYIYYAGGCTNIGCTAFTKATYYAPLDAYGSVGAWSTGGTMPGGGGVAWGKLLTMGGNTLYYVGGQTGNATTTAVSTVYYTTGISSGNPTWGTATKTITNTAGTAQTRTQFGAAVWNNRIYVVGGYSSAGTVQSTVLVSPQMNSGGNITANWSSGSTSFNVARAGLSVVAYANNLYVLGGYDGTNYLSDTQFSQISTSTGDAGAWAYSTSLPNVVRDGEAFAANGYIYVVGGRSAASACRPITLFAPISANTTIVTGNNPTGVGVWSETNQRYTGDRYGAAVAYSQGRVYVVGGGCSSFVSSSDRMYYSTLKSQPQVAKYSRLIDTDSNVFPNSWLMNGIDNSIGARWQGAYQSAVTASNVVLQQSFDDGTNGNNVVPSNSAYDSCWVNNNGTNKYSNAQYVTPGLSARIQVTTGVGAGACTDDFNLTLVRYDRYYIRFDSVATLSGNTVISSWKNGSNTVADLRITTAGQLQLRDLNTAKATTTALANSTWHRIETAIVNDQLIVRTFEGANVNGTTPTQTQTINLTNSPYDDFDEFNVGITTSINATWGMYIDEHTASSSNWVGPAYPGWGQTTTQSDIIPGDVMSYTPLDSAGNNTSFARWYFFVLSIDASQTFGYPEDVTRGPTIADLSLFFTADPNKRLRHGKTFTGGELQPLDTPCRQSVDAQCPLP